MALTPRSAEVGNRELSMLELAYFACFDRVPPHPPELDEATRAVLLQEALLHEEAFSASLHPSAAGLDRPAVARWCSSGPCQPDETQFA